MPIYEFRCRECGTVFEAIRPVGDEGDGLRCPACGSSGHDKQFSVFAASSPGRAAEGCPSAASCGSGGFS